MKSLIRFFAIACGSVGLFLSTPAWAADLDELQEQAIKAAVKKAAPWIVQIETTGGTEVIPTGPPGRGGQVRKGVGPTTGVIVSADGFVITSAFNFANKPQKIFVSVPGHKDRYIGEMQATDHTRMVTLLKIMDAPQGLPVAEVSPKDKIAVGQTVIALGRTLDPIADHSPSVSVGIISALGRIWGKAIQTDCKVSPANYGGPLVDLEGKVVGILVPASPSAEDEAAGVEWYDSGIGFAIPLEDINKVLDKLKQKKDLSKGTLGIQPQGQDIYSTLPVVATVAPGSPADRAGIKPGAKILAIDGHAVVNHAQIRHRLGPKYDGDEVKIKFQNSDEKEPKEVNVVLSATVETVARAYLGILPMRDDPELGVEIRYVFPGGPAAQAKLLPGDRITKVGLGAAKPGNFFNGQVSGRDQLATFLATQRPGSEIKFEVVRKEGGKTEEVTVKLGDYNEDLPDAKAVLPDASKKKALEPRKTVPPVQPQPKVTPKEDPKVSFFERSNESGDRKFYVYVPDGKRYDPQIAHGVIVWLHPPGKGKKDAIEDIEYFWERNLCDKYNWIFIAPVADDPKTGWVGSDADSIREAVTAVSKDYTVDPRRIVVHGMDQGGEFAYYMGFHARDMFRGVVAVGSALGNAVKSPIPNQPLAFFVVVGNKDPLLPQVQETKSKLDKEKYPVTYREVADMAHQYLTHELADKTFDDVLRWLDCMDRM
jgi:S1-C subfamily serine protease